MLFRDIRLMFSGVGRVGSEGASLLNRWREPSIVEMRGAAASLRIKAGSFSQSAPRIAPAVAFADSRGATLREYWITKNRVGDVN